MQLAFGDEAKQTVAVKIAELKKSYTGRASITNAQGNPLAERELWANTEAIGKVPNREGGCCVINSIRIQGSERL